MIERNLQRLAGHVGSGLAAAMLVVGSCLSSAAVAQDAKYVPPENIVEGSNVGTCANSVGSPSSPTVLPHPSAGEVKDTVLRMFNAARARVGVEPVVWDDQLARGSEYWATMVVNNKTWGVHDPDRLIGGEIMSGGENGALFTVEQLVNGWMLEKANFKNEPFPQGFQYCIPQGGAGHYFGLIRRALYRVGCAAVSGGPKGRVLVCRLEPGYAPKGEMAYPLGEKASWPARTLDTPSLPWVQGARPADFADTVLQVNKKARPALGWDANLANKAQDEAVKRMLDDNPFTIKQVDTEIINVASIQGGISTTFAVPATMYGDFIAQNPDILKKIATSAWTSVGCGSAIREVTDGTKVLKNRIVVCHYS